MGTYCKTYLGRNLLQDRFGGNLLEVIYEGGTYYQTDLGGTYYKENLGGNLLPDRFKGGPYCKTYLGGNLLLPDRYRAELKGQPIVRHI